MCISLFSVSHVEYHRVFSLAFTVDIGCTNKRLASIFNCVLFGLDSLTSKPFEFQTAYPIELKLSTHLEDIVGHQHLEFHHHPPRRLDSTVDTVWKVPFYSVLPKVWIRDQRFRSPISRLVFGPVRPSLDTKST